MDTRCYVGFFRDGRWHFCRGSFLTPTAASLHAARRERATGSTHVVMTASERREAREGGRSLWLFNSDQAGA